MAVLPPLPYEYDALEPHISARTVEIHYSKHHQGYVDKLNKALKDKSDEREKSLEEIIKRGRSDLFNNAAQIWNHSFYWQSMRAGGGGEPGGMVKKGLIEQFGSIDRFKAVFAETAKTQFGSGWAWLVWTQDEKLEVLSTSDAENPMQKNHHPLLTVDVWEHAYYLDYQNERGRYVDGVIEHLLNWDFAEKNLAACLERRHAAETVA